MSISIKFKAGKMQDPNVISFFHTLHGSGWKLNTIKKDGENVIIQAKLKA